MAPIVVTRSDRLPPPADMQPADFERALELGLGRAVLYLREHDAAPHRAAILRCCIHADPYFDSRGAYLFEVLQVSGDPGSYLDEILSALRASTSQGDAAQLLDLALHFAQAGHAAARDALYEKVLRNELDQPFMGADRLIRLDGDEGILAVAEHIGRALLGDPPDWWSTSTWLDLVEACREEHLAEVLGRARATSPVIAAFADAVEAHLAQQHGPPGRRKSLVGASYARVRKLIRGSRGPHLVGLPAWGRAASDEDLARAAADLVTEDDEGRLRTYLFIFRNRRFPLDPAPLLALTRHPNRRIAGRAYTALSHVPDPRVRAHALAVLDDPTAPGHTKGWAVDLLIANYQPGDAARLDEWLAESRDRDELHSIGLGALAVIEAHPAPESVPALLVIYELSPCALCRGRALEHLYNLGAAPAWMLDEARLDASPDVRELVAEWAMPSPPDPAQAAEPRGADANSPARADRPSRPNGPLAEG